MLINPSELEAHGLSEGTLRVGADAFSALGGSLTQDEQGICSP
jgi:hypothetical protein